MSNVTCEINYLFEGKDYLLLHLRGHIWKYTRDYNKSAQEIVGNKNDESFPITAKKPGKQETS